MPVEAPKPETRKPTRSGVVVPFPPRWYQRLAARLVHWFSCSLAATLRFEWRDDSGLLQKPISSPVIFCLWHNRLALCMTAYDVYAAKRKRDKLAALISASKDGALLAAILESFGVQPVRGSSSRRGPQALLELTTWADRGYDVAITPDGPRGPCYIVQDGVMAVAQLTGMPIVPFSFNTVRKVQFKSWDRFQLPLPFSRCEMVLGHPVSVPRDISDEQRNALRQQLQNELNRISRD